MERIFVVKTYTNKELGVMYRISVKTLTKWIIGMSMETHNNKILSPKQVRQPFDYYGLPKEDY